LLQDKDEDSVRKFDAMLVVFVVVLEIRLKGEDRGSVG